MKINKPILAWFLSALTMIVLDWIYLQIVISVYGEQNIDAMSFLEWTMFTLPVAAIMTYLYPKGYNRGRPAIEGLKFGALIGFLMFFPILALSFMPPYPAGMNLLWHVFEQGMMGLVIGLVYGKDVS